MRQLGLAEVTHGLAGPVEDERGDSDAAVLFDQSGPPATVTVGQPHRFGYLLEVTGVGRS